MTDLEKYDLPEQTAELGRFGSRIGYETCKEKGCLRPVYAEGRCKAHADWHWYRKARK